MNVDSTFNIDTLLLGLSSNSVAVLKMPSHQPGQRELPFPLFHQNEFVSSNVLEDKRQLSERDDDTSRSSFP